MDEKQPRTSRVFLKRQRYWGFAGLAIWIIGLSTLLGSLSYSLNYSDGMKMGLQIANSNKRLTEYFGHPIEKSSFLSGSYNYIVSPKPSTLSIDFNANGPQSNGHIHFQWEKRGEDWVATEIAFADSEGKTRQLVHSPTIESSFFTKMPYEKNILQNFLNRMIQEKDGYVILVRSEENNDFLQTAAELSDDGNVVFSVIYSDGYTRWNKKVYQSKNFIQNKEEIIKLFTLYATGDDSHINLVEWNKLTSIKPAGRNSAYSIFGEKK